MAWQQRGRTRLKKHGQRDRGRKLRAAPVSVLSLLEPGKGSHSQSLQRCVSRPAVAHGKPPMSLLPSNPRLVIHSCLSYLQILLDDGSLADAMNGAAASASLEAQCGVFQQILDVSDPVTAQVRIQLMHILL